MIASATVTNASININDNFGMNIVNPNLKIFPEEIDSVEKYIKNKGEVLGMRKSDDNIRNDALINPYLKQITAQIVEAPEVKPTVYSESMASMSTYPALPSN
jgi:hypothetical protein